MEVRKNAVEGRGAEFIPTGLLLGHPLPHPGLGIQVCNEETPVLLLAPGPEPLTSTFLKYSQES